MSLVRSVVAAAIEWRNVSLNAIKPPKDTWKKETINKIQKQNKKDKRNAYQNGSVPNNPRKRGKKNKQNEMKHNVRWKQSNEINEKQD